MGTRDNRVVDWEPESKREVVELTIACAVHEKYVMNRNSAVLSQWASAFEKSFRVPRKRFKVPFAYNKGIILCFLDYNSLWFVLET